MSTDFSLLQATIYSENHYGCLQNPKSSKEHKFGAVTSKSKCVKCPYCSKKFTSSKELDDHAYLHLENTSEATPTDKPFICNEGCCAKKFRKASRSMKHIKTAHYQEFHEISSEAEDNIDITCCDFKVIEQIYMAIEATKIPSFFYTRQLPLPNGIDTYVGNGLF